MERSNCYERYVESSKNITDFLTGNSPELTEGRENRVKILNTGSIKSLQEIRQKPSKKKMAGDLQFLIAKDGSMVLNDLPDIQKAGPPHYNINVTQNNLVFEKMIQLSVENLISSKLEPDPTRSWTEKNLYSFRKVLISQKIL